MSDVSLVNISLESVHVHAPCNCHLIVSEKVVDLLSTSRVSCVNEPSIVRLQTDQTFSTILHPQCGVAFLT